MRILHVINMGTICGGAERLVADLAGRQRAAGHQVLVLASDLPGSGERFSDLCWAQADRRRGLPARLAGQLRNPAAETALAGVLRDWRPHVVHLHTVGLLAPRSLRVLVGTPTVLTVHGPEPYVPRMERWCMPPHYFRHRDGVRGRLTWRGYLAVVGTAAVIGRLWRRNLRVVDVYTAPSAYLVGMVGRDFTPVRLVPNGYDPPDRESTPRSDGTRVLFMGRLEDFKGAHILLAALAVLGDELPDTRLSICGTGSGEPALRHLVDELGLTGRVELAGWRGRDDLTERLAGTDIVVVPSVWPEAFGLTCLEAFAAGKPVVASSVGSLPELVRPGVTGLLVPPGDPQALAGALRTLLRDEPLRDRLGSQGRDLARRYPLQAHVDGVAAAYEEAIERHPRPSTTTSGFRELVRDGLRDSLVRNSMMMLLGTVVLAGGGFLFWQLVTHLFPPAEVGQASAAVSAATLIANLALLGMNNALIRYLPVWPDRSRTINSAVTLVVLAAAFGAIGFVVASARLAPRLTELRHPVPALVFVLLTIAGTASLVYDNVFVSLRHSGYLLARNVIVVVLRLALPAVLLAGHAVGVFTAYWLAVTLSMTLYLVVLAHRFGLPVRPAIGLSRLRAMWRYAAGTYLATAIIMVPNLLMPVLVAQRVDPAHAAYYYIASLVASVLGFVPQAVSRSLFAELAAEPAPDPETARAHLLLVLRLTVVGQLPILALLLLCGRPVLGLFSPVYADAYPLLVLLALTGVASSVSFVGSTLLLADGRLRLLCQLSAVSCAVALLGAYLLGGRGLVWVGWSLLAAEGVLAVGYLRVIAGRLRAPRREVTPCG